ncbi:CP2 transcription factor [Metarhizium album ARSEF 1941]|uniref:CP2 transcription factor n=1 Tax=Metarhizium album (strain ARSEF 1941) TaxID=1081103 RepID=A0A0B2X3X0_METAS|nr:CP2 transcription factor [Metarhizium album ARSEF 1941]KHO01054.1 CP2 transcription factor [Metarhizium album ARSEF 1941]
MYLAIVIIVRQRLWTLTTDTGYKHLHIAVDLVSFALSRALLQPRRVDLDLDGPGPHLHLHLHLTFIVALTLARFTASSSSLPLPPVPRHALTSSQKPGDDLLANFRQQFPEVAAVTSEASAPTLVQATSAVNHPIITLPPQDQRNPGVETDVFRDQDPTPRASHEPWRFTPSLLDPNSYAFNAFANAQSGYYAATPGGNNPLLQSQAGDLHTPTMGAGGIATPLSMPNPGDAVHAGGTVMDMSGFQTLQPHQFHHFNPFVHGASFAPTSFVHQDAGYETMEQDGVVLEAASSEHRMPPMVPSALQHQKAVNRMQVSHALPPNAEKFRFHCTLNAPTAMIKHADEIPITYLNKGQAYSLSVADPSGTFPTQPGTKYRTFVRVSFEDEEQRQKPNVCWGLWKEGRGTNEAHQRGGKLQAVEFVEAGQPAEPDDKGVRIEVESSSFDGFCVTWTPGANGPPEVNLAVRFNFLSTDFSHSKGVKGIPVRLCAKTSLVPADGSLKDAETSPEVCFCKVKLFRDHGAERKLSNDIAHVKKSIDKLKQQLAQIESGMKDMGKRKRISNATKASDPQRPGKVQKHKRTWSMSSASSTGGGGSRMTLEEDLQIKLQTLQDMFTSTRPLSILYLRGEDLDDPDLHPVSLPGDMSPPNKLEVSREGSNWQVRSTKSSVTGSMISPSPSSLSLVSQASGMWQNMDNTSSGKTFEQISRISRIDDAGNLSGWIEALGVDPSYRPPPEQAEKSVACFYIQYRDKSEQEKTIYHRAIYLKKRTIEEFNGRIASKWGVEPAKVLRAIHAIQGGVEVEMDDDVIRELKEGQDMQLEIEEVIEQPTETKREWKMSMDETGADADDVAPPAKGFVLRLAFETTQPLDSLYRPRAPTT